MEQAVLPIFLFAACAAAGQEIIKGDKPLPIDAAQRAKVISQVLQELDDLRSERKQVRTRIEKLLGQLDLLGST